jgi:hypothetical protein
VIVGASLSNHPNDQAEAEPTLAAIPPEVGEPTAAALDAGYFGPATLEALEGHRSEPDNATGRAPHHRRGQGCKALLPAPPPTEASPTVQIAYKLKTALGQAIYGARKCTVEPVLGMIKSDGRAASRAASRGIRAISGPYACGAGGSRGDPLAAGVPPLWCAAGTRPDTGGGRARAPPGDGGPPCAQCGE